MSCLQGCDNCECQETNVCNSTEEMEKSLNNKLKVLKDFVCVIRTTSCPNLAKMLSQYAYYLWCFLKDIVNYLINLDKRVSNLCSSIKCVNEKANSIINYLRKDAFNNIKINTYVEASGRPGVTMMTGNIDANGAGSFRFTTNNYNGFEYGVGHIYFRVGRSYDIDGNGNMIAKLGSIAIDSADWQMKSPNTNPNNNLSLVIRDLHGNVIWRKNYTATNSWNERINKNIEIGITRTITPHSQTGNILMLQIEDNWILNTSGKAYINFINNNTTFPINSGDCGIHCDKC